ncbi:protein FAR1-RELATED SEQUENCE 6-like [Typha angustifolia]|uniref:protein FAR1-RELATED SEQUENCE 6-like n=1 Tax=Typha angustifolia TaxID=59011 RepID=UPI003C2F8C4B
MGRRPAQSDAKPDTPKPKLKRKKGRRKAIPIPEPPEREEPGSSSDVIAPRKGMVFKTLEEICDFYNRYAQHLGFATKIKASSHKRSYIQIMCWKGRKRDKRRLDALAPRPTIYTNCPAVVKVGLSQYDSMYHIKEVVLEHNHELNPLRMHFFRDENMLGAGVKKRLRSDYGDVHVEAARDQNLSLQGREWMTSVEEVQRLKLAKEDVEAINWFFGHMQSSNSNFFYLMDIDNECHLKNVFWADGRSRSAYRYFGDVLLLDTSYLTSKFNVPLAAFVGVNNHGQSVLMGCGLLSDESTRTFVWLLRALLSCMPGHPPHAIITDNGSSIQEAVKQVLPGCPHRFCLSQIMRRIPEMLEGLREYKEIKKSLKKVVYESLRHHEFEMKWQNMIEKYGLIYNDWLRSLYQDRHHWVPAFVKDTFWAGMSITIRGENMDSFFEGHLESSTSVNKFLNQYEMTMETKYESEALADFESFHKVPPLSTQFYMEEQLSEIYTIDIFMKFQDEVKALVYCHPSLIKTDGSVHTFEVKERIRVKESKVMEQKIYEVIFKESGQDVQCICCSYQFRGILCRHALSVLNFQDIDEVPFQYITERWRKDFKGLQAASYPPYEMVANGPMERYENLYKRCLKLADVGSMSDDKYEFSLKIMNQAMGKLLEENFTSKGKKVKIMFDEPTTDQNDVHDATTNANENLGKGSYEVEHVTEERRKGKRKKQKEPLVGTLDNNKEKEQVNLSNSPAIFHTMVPLAFQRTITASSWNPWNFPPVNQIQPSNLLYYAAAPVNNPQYRLLLQKDQIGHPSIGGHSGDLRNPQQTLEKTQKTEATPCPKRKKRKSSQIVELSS